MNRQFAKKDTRTTLRDCLMSDNLLFRIGTTTVLFLLLFLFITIISYYLLPQGFLVKKNSTSGFETSRNILLSTFQIFGFNVISVFFIFVGSAFAKRKNDTQNYLGYGYYCFFVLVVMNALTLGTWSFSSNMDSVSLINRIIGFFRIWKNTGFIEMFG